MVWLLLGVLLWTSASSALAASADVARGLTWLQGQVQASGQLATVSFRATVAQAQCETSQTLLRLAGNSAQVTTLVGALPSSGADAPTETLACWQFVRQQQGQSANAGLASRRIDQGGFAAYEGMLAASPLDTGWAVAAISSVASSADKQGIHAWLESIQQADGAFKADARFNIYTTSIVLRGLKEEVAKNPQALQVAQKAATYLLAKRSAAGIWGNDPALTALAFEAVHPYSASDATLAVAVETYLLAKQQSNGSWANDPYITALALRALALTAVTPQTSGQPLTTGTLQGSAQDAGGQPLAGVAIAAVPSSGGPAKVVMTDAQGNYAIANLRAGPISISAAKDGYSQLSASGTIQAGGVLIFSPVLTPAVVVTPPVTPPAPGVTTAIVSGTVKDGAGQALAGVTVTVTPVGGTALTATTNAQGAYTIANVPAGTMTLSASKTGYVTVNASATLAAGATGIFSPELKSSSDPSVTQVAISGQVVAADTKAPLAGVTVTIETSSGPSVTATTDANGRFNASAAAGSLKLTYAKTGYTSVTQQATAPGGTAVNAGVVQLAMGRQTSSLRGVVTDTQGAPIAGATVGAAGKTAITNSAGAYLIAEFTGSPVTVNISAGGYQTRSYQLTIGAPGDIVQDFVLPKTSGDVYLELKDLKIQPASAGLNEDLTATVLVSNPSTAPANSAVMLEVQDPNGKIIAQLSGLDVSGLPMGVVNLAPAEQTSVKFQWNTASVPAGSYTLLVKLYVPGSRSTSNPTGTVTGLLRGQLTVRESAHFSGSAVADPPVVQAGANTPVKLTALVRNDGNVALAAATYLLTVVDSKSGMTVHQASASGPAISLSAIATVDFGQWTPTTSGSYQLEVTSAAAPGSKVLAPLYVGDMAKGSFTVDKTVVPPGTQQVKGNIHVTGIDMASGTSVDPLAAVIRDAVVKAVNYGDNYAFNHYVGDLRCYACHVQTQAVVGGERNLRFAQPLDPSKRVALLNGILQNITSSGYVEGAGYSRTNTNLGLWATNEWHDQVAVHNANRQMVDFLLSVQQSNGSWYQDHSSSWYDSQASATGLNLGSLVNYSKQLKQAGAGKKPVLSPLNIKNLPSGDMRLSAGSDGTLYIAHISANAIYKVAPGSDSAALLLSGLPVTGARPIAGGNLLISARSGVYLGDLRKTMLQVADLRQLNTLDTFDAQVYPKGGYIVSPWGGRSIYQLSDGGTLTRLIDSDLLGSSSGTTQIDADGSILVNAHGPQRMLRFAADGTYKNTPIPYSNGRPIESMPYKDGYMLGTDTGLYYYNKDWVVERLAFSRTYGQVQLPDGRVIVNTNSSLYSLSLDVVPTQPLLGQVDSAVDKASDWLAAGSGIDQNNNIQQAFRLMGLAKAKAHYVGTPRYKAYDALMTQLGQALWSRQRADGGWERGVNWYNQSDPVVTAIVGVALDTLNPSKDDPKLRQAIQYVLAAQRGDGSWLSTNGLGGTLLSSTWIEIWLPTMLDRLGSIDGDLHVTFGPEVTVTSPEPPVTSTTSHPDGTVEYVWKLTGVTGAGRDVDFDLTLKDMGEQEVRPVARQASLVFKNSFTSGEVISPVVVPRVASNARMGLQVSTDKPSYWATDIAIFTSPVTNGGVAARDAQVRFTVLDNDGKTVAVLPLPAIVSVDKGGTQNVLANWNVAGVLAGPYQVLAELIATDGTVYGSAKAPFTVKGSQGPANATRISTDKAQYTSAQPVQVQSVASNVSVNFLQEALTAETVVLDAQGKEVLRKRETIVQLPPTARRQYVYALAAGSLPPGVYTARLTLMGRSDYKSSQRTAARDHLKASPGDVVLSESVTSFQVVAAAVCNPGVAGNLLAQPAPVAPGQTVALNLQLDNPATSAIGNATVRLRIVDAENGILIEEQSVTGVSVAASGQYKTTWNWQAKGNVGQNFLAIATLETAGCADVVAHASLTLAQIAPPGGGAAVAAVPLNLHAPLLLLLPLLAWGVRRRRSQAE
ncbi:carboxypeptidase regulatory-like domain-containing protein [Ottowia testudinis]|uniref:Carboxypeptidase regulatory-like domain-containing protein n=1 Tax=Ottowia testudinis TaxID=2816950 RepID=A0A975H1G3_9BURK|nr:carboxypeptidase regulatory-like domain-containing protein [Ottowia testudinis]QTD43729.1 carboxypeptidase regulatory-like domain-containing protein [Ottowia testudinis]